MMDRIKGIVLKQRTITYAPTPKKTACPNEMYPVIADRITQLWVNAIHISSVKPRPITYSLPSIGMPKNINVIKAANPMTRLDGKVI